MFHLAPFYRALRRLRDSEFAGVTTLVALALPVLLGATGLVFDINRGYQQRAINQRAADMGALAAAMAYSNTSNTAVLTPTAQDIARANGLVGATVTAALVNNFPAAGQQAVRVTVVEQVPVTLSRVLGVAGSYSVQAQALASLSASGAVPCYLALSPASDAVTVSGGGTITLPSCALAAIGTIANTGALIQGSEIISGQGSVSTTYGTLTAGKVRYAGSFTAPAWNTNVPPVQDRIQGATTLSDPWANDPTRVAAMGLIGQATSIPTLANPTTPTGGANWNFTSSNPTGQVATWRQGTSSSYVVPAGNYTVGRIDVAGGVSVTFTSGSTIRIRSGFFNSGSSVNFGNSDVYVNGGFNSGSSGVTFGNGVLWIGSGTVTFAGTNTKGTGDVTINATVSLGGGQNLTMGAGNHSFARLVIAGGGTARLGAGNFLARTGISIDGNSELSLGAGNVLIGSHTDGHAVRLAGSGRFFMGDGTYASVGHILTAGGSRLVFGRTNNHFLNGNLTISGAVLFGRGRYTINGNITNSTGGTVWPYTSSLTGITYGSTLEGTSVSGYDQAGIDVTFVLAGVMNLAGGARTILYAPTATVTGGEIGELLLSSASTAASSWDAGSNNRFAGTIHLPNSVVTMTGGNSTVASKCLSLIASKIAVSGGAATGSACAKMQSVNGSATGGTAVRLVG